MQLRLRNTTHEQYNAGDPVAERGDSLTGPMRFREALFLILLLNLCLAPPCLRAQAGTDAAQQLKRPEATRLFNQGKHLDALPLLEELARADPKNDEILVALAASLVDHAATLRDQEAAAKERFRARDLLEKALSLGNTSTLALNLA
jgi:hypothetical protein